MYAMLTGRTRTDGAAKGVLTAHCKLRIRAYSCELRRAKVRKYMYHRHVPSKLPSYEGTKVLSYFRKYFRKYEGTSVLYAYFSLPSFFTLLCGQQRFREIALKSTLSPAP